ENKIVWSTMLVTFGKMFEKVSILHNVLLPTHLVKVIIEKVCDGSVIVHVPIDEVTTIAQTLQTFIVVLDI
ncbi:unnamed protein product, partial [Sphenostylis stenocarpa]